MRNIADIGRDCCGCGACAQACGTGAIEMKTDAEGFFAPVVDESKCVGCALCLKLCPQKNEIAGSEPKDVYAAYAAADAEVLSRSSSGGLFSAAGKIALEEGAAVYGAALNEGDWTVSLDSARDEAAMAKFCGSKYVQSRPFADFRAVAKSLGKGEKVFFAGCPCQVAALKSFVGEEARANLTTMDIICHGTPSPLLFQNYIAWLSKKENAKISRYRFRTKERGWGMTLSYRAGERERFAPSILDRYNFHFLSGNDYRECCYRCRYAVKARQGDITLGDYWGVLREHPEFYTEKGVSMALVNTEKGRALFEKMKPHIAFIPSSFERAARHNENLVRPSKRPAERDGFYEGIGSMPAAEFVDTKMAVHPRPKAVIKALTPWRLKRFYQKLLQIRRKIR